MQLIVVRFDEYRFGIDTTNLSTTTHSCDITPIPGSGDCIAGTLLYDNTTRCVIDMNKWLECNNGDAIDSYVIFKKLVFPVHEVCGVLEVGSGDLIHSNNFIDPDKEGIVTDVFLHKGDLCFVINLAALESKLLNEEDNSNG